MKKVKIVECSSIDWWYQENVGKVYEVLEESVRYDGLNYITKDGVVLASDTIEVTDRKEPRIYEKDGKKYLLPEWAKYVTSHSGTNVGVLSAWEKKPEYRDGCLSSGYGWWHNSVNYGDRVDLYEYIPPLPEGVFIEDVSNI